jgi:hypothetical protein
MLAASCVAQVVSQRRTRLRHGQPVGLLLLTAGLAGLVVASPLKSLPLLLAGAVLAGAGHRCGFLHAQEELNRIAPAERRGEVTAAFITSVGLLDVPFSLVAGVSTFAVVIGTAAVATAGWHAVDARARA